MTANNDFSTIVKSFLEDADFADQLKSDPLATLSEKGMDMSMLATKLNMDNGQMKDYLQNVFNSQTFTDFEQLATAMGDSRGGA